MIGLEEACILSDPVQKNITMVLDFGAELKKAQDVR